MKRTEYFVSFETSVVLTEECIIVVNGVELIGTIDYVMQYVRCRIKWCRYNRVRLYCISVFKFLLSYIGI